MEAKQCTLSFFEQDDYFNRGHLYGYNDEAERFTFFTHAIIDYYLLCENKPNIVHCHDWQTGLLPLYLKQHEELKVMKSVFTIHNLRYQGIFPSSIYNELLELPSNLYSTVEMDGNVSFLKTAIMEADHLTTVSPTYANQIQSSEGGFGLHELLASRAHTLCGIVNGLDQVSYQPASDQSLVYPDSPSPEMKKINKRAIQIELNLQVDSEIPLFAFISRLVNDKGVSLLLEALNKITPLINSQSLAVGIRI
ncbi:glycogen/starch synthase [Bacillus sp. JCM 19041]|uniref:glycogen synthase n=1 Tax=Bacillus sp. JCM 19041 TaxID=1460637 RepID=UPI000B08680D